MYVVGASAYKEEILIWKLPKAFKSTTTGKARKSEKIQREEILYTI